MMNPLEINELQKAMILRGVDYETSELIIHDFRARCVEILGADRYHEIMQAEREGRLWITPCKNGDTVYVVGKCRVMECYIQESYLEDDGGTEHLVSFECDNDCEGCPFNNWHQDYSGEYSCDGEWGQGAIKEKDFGKTVFLTREAAEKALEEANGKGN